MATPTSTVSIPRHTITNPFLDGLIWGNAWNLDAKATREITYSFDNGSLVSSWSSADKNILRAALKTWEDVANIKFKEVSYVNINVANNPADIVYLAGSTAQFNTLFGEDTSSIVGYHDTPANVSVLYHQEVTDNISAPNVGAFNTGMPAWGQGAGSYAFDTIVHEIGHGLGLAHPHDRGGGSSIFAGVSEAFGDYGIYGQNQGINTVMSYNAGWHSEFATDYTSNTGHVNTPMALDIAAIQAIYGANTTHQNGDNTYYLPRNSSASERGWSSIWDTGGIDTITNEGQNHAAIINLNAADLTGSDAGGSPSYQTGLTGGFTIANSVVIENAIGGNGGDLITGNNASNILRGMGGNDTLIGGGGYDVIDGGAGHDIVQFSGARNNYQLISHNSVVGVLSNGADGSDKVIGAETLDFSDLAIQTSQVQAFAIRDYMASNSDLLSIFGNNSSQMFDHYIQYGFNEGRQTNSFSGLEYIASHTDLMNAFGADAAKGRDHYIDHGHQEARTITFKTLEYIASYNDLSIAFGANSNNGAQHYISYGRAEGRQVTFDGLEYIASHSDLASVFGANAELGAQHYINYGRTEGRQATFDSLEYIASYSDLAAAFGTNKELAAEHYITYGRNEGREVTFDALAYIASYGDLISAFGTNQDAAAEHYINYGRTEGRSSSFDIEAYLDTNPQFQGNVEDALTHYIETAQQAAV